MASKLAIKRLQWLIWILIYGGLLAIVVSTFLGPSDAALAVCMKVGGVTVVAVGAALIYVRSRLTESS